MPDLFHRIQRWWWMWIGILALTLWAVWMNWLSWWQPSVMIDLGDFSGIALLMLLYHHRAGRTHNAVYRAVAWVGLYSYGIYLWHVSVDRPIDAVARHLPAWSLPLWLGIVPMLMGIALGVVTTKVIEFPMLRLRERWFPRQVDSAVGTPAEVEADERARSVIRYSSVDGEVIR